jgi:hypothetical protein
MPNPHRHVGTSEADIVGDLQRIKTAILRQGLDSLYLANNPRHIVSNQVNLDDMQISRPGGLVRMVENSSAIPAEGHAVPIVTPFVFPQAIEGMEYMDQIRENRTGTNRYFTGVDQNALNKTATGVQALSTMAAQRVEQIARVFASGVEYLFSVAHELLLKSGIEKDVIKLRGKWVQIDPSTWKTGRDMRICVGYGAGNKDALIGRLGMILQAQAQSREQGLRVASEQNTYEALIELTKASDFSAPGRFWTDPTTLPPPQPIPSEHEIYAAVEGQKIASSERTDFAQIQSNERIKVADLTQKNQSDQLEAEVRLIIEQMKQGGGIDLEKVKAHFRDAPIRVETEKIDNASKVLEQLVNLNQQQTQHFSELGKRLENLVTQLNAPKRIIRGKDGRAEGVEAVNGSAKRN